MIVALLFTVLAGASPAPARYAIVIGSNHPLPGSDYEALQYADDDAIRFAELFEGLGADTTLLTVPDAETMDRFGATAKKALRPTLAELDRVLARVEAELSAEKNREREVYFIFSGHGSITSSEAYLHLFDGSFTRTDLFERVLKRLEAEHVHVIIDSCHSYFLVNARGQRVALAEDEESLDRYPWVGFFLSTSDRREVQEWSGYKAGVFSHQILGALRGAADVDGDGRVSYAEGQAYIVAANAEVARPDARIQPYVRRPSIADKTLLDLTGVPRERKLRVGTEIEGHFWLADEHRGRILDANKSKPGQLELLLIDGEQPLLEQSGARYRIVRSATAPAELAALASDEAPAFAGKGSVADELRTNLFRVPLTTDFVRGVDVASPQVTRVYVRRSGAGSWHRDPLTLGLFAGGGLLIAGGGASTALFAVARSEANTRPITPDTEHARERAELWRMTMIAGYAAGGALLAAGVLRAIWTNDDSDPLALSVGTGGDGVVLSFGGNL